MFFRQHKIYENRLSEQISDDNPYKKKLIEMETPSHNHPIYSALVFGLLGYSWLFFFVLLYKLAYIQEMSETDFLYVIISAVNIIFITITIIIVYGKDYLISVNPQYNFRIYIIAVISYILSIIIAVADTGSASWHEIFMSFCFWDDINKKSYIALAIVLYLALGISLFYYSSPYFLYRSFYSIHKEFPELKNVEKSINKGFYLFLLFLIASPLLMKIAFVPPRDGFSIILKFSSLFAIGFGIPCLGNEVPAKKYIYTFNKAKKIEKEEK